MKKTRKLVKFIFFLLLSLPKTIYFNLRTLPLRLAVRLPVVIGYNVKISETHKGCVRFSPEARIRFAMIRFGFGGPQGVISNRRGEVCLEAGFVEFGGTAYFGEGSSLRVSGELFVGDHFSASKNSFVSCASRGSRIGSGVMMGWNTALRDSDGHTVYQKGEPKVSQKPFLLGDHVWICAEAHVLKGVEIGSHSIVAYRSTVTKSFPEPHSLVGGSPAIFIAGEVDWGPFVI